jgi:rhodanese-related sulfurtransferase
MGVKNVTVTEAHQKQAEGYTYVDVRSEQEFEAGHPAGAVNVPLLRRDAATGRMSPNPEFLGVMKANFPADAKLLIGCQIGGRSAQASQLLAASGFSDVSNVLGGYGGGRSPAEPGWAPSGLPTEHGTGTGRSYDSMRREAPGRAGGGQ